MREHPNVSNDDRALKRSVDRVIELERFRSWRQTGDRAIRDAIIADAQGLAIGLARRFRDRGAELDDLVQVAQIGLLHAVERFDPDRGIPFLSFAMPTVLGELRRHFRSVWSVRVPRGLQEASLRLGPVLTELQQELGRSPTVSDVAERMECTTEAVLEAMEASQAYRAQSIEAWTGADSDDSNKGGGAQRQLHSPAAEAAFDSMEAKRTIEQLLPLLSPRSRRIVELRFFENLSQTEIAEAVGLSQMHVSRLLRQAMKELSGVLESE